MQINDHKINVSVLSKEFQWVLKEQITNEIQILENKCMKYEAISEPERHERRWLKLFERT
jgi:hypothetical protein